MEDILSHYRRIFVPEASRELLVVHLGLVLPHAPAPGHLVGVRHLELPAVASPPDEVLARLVRQQLQQELPQLDGTRTGEAGAHGAAGRTAGHDARGAEGGQHEGRGHLLAGVGRL